MSVFDVDIVTKSLRVENGYNISIEFVSCSNYNLADLFYGAKLWKNDIDHADTYVCKIFGDTTIDMFDVWIKESDLGLTRTLRKYLKKHYLRHNCSDTISFIKHNPHIYEICFSLPKKDCWNWGSGGRTTIYPEIKVMFIPK